MYQLTIVGTKDCKKSKNNKRLLIKIDFDVLLELANTLKIRLAKTLKISMN
jgi:hypothetical protein